MAAAVTVPRLGWNMDEGIFVGWLRADGDHVRAGEPIFALEGEKATQEVEALDEGTLRIAPDGPKAGDRVAVGAVVGYIVESGEECGSRIPGSQIAEGISGICDVRSVHLQSTPLTRPLLGGPLPQGEGEETPRSSPLARRIARELGIDWTRLRGSGRTGRVRKADVIAAASRQSHEPETHDSIPLSQNRRAIAARLAESQRATVPVTLTTTVEATNLVAIRGQFKASGGLTPSYTDFIARLAALALREHPMLNARLEGDHVLIPKAIHIGIAVDTDAGLVVPVVRDADSLGLKALSEGTRTLIDRARRGALQASEMQGGTFTITNLGAFGVEAFTPVINPPECAILGMGRIVRRPAMRGDQVVGREEMTLSLTFDHRIVDGAPAARFLQRLAQMIENPAPWLVS